ncbi:energy transducer TonB [Desertivirga brevis]|uniref:energy transducer TonB n=1 Tax=Desertivirga brevis TaxID=2810310 RepID=UPI001A967094|nr:energy transducer TonB [Pedobacter sp. SYSU D00873]
MTFLNFLIQVNIYLTLFYLFYAVFLKNETFFNANRLYLILTTLLSVAIPTLKLPWILRLLETEKVEEVTQIVMLSAAPIILRPDSAEYNLGFRDYIMIIYFAGVIGLTIRFLIRLIALFVITPKAGSAYSFFHIIIVSDELEGKDAIIEHEKVHRRQLHSADVLLFELMIVFNWLNPVVYAYKKAIKSIHEFIADEISTRNTNKADYALLLLGRAVDVPSRHLTNNFFNDSLLKRRIIMLNKTKSRKAAILKYGLSAPLFALMLIFSSAVIESDAKDVGTIGAIKQQKLTTLEVPAPEESSRTTNSTISTERRRRLTENQKQDLASQVARTSLAIIQAVADSSIYEVGNVEIQPQFPGGMQAFYTFVGKNFTYPKEAREKGVKGRIIINFVVEPDGRLTSFKTVRDLNYGTGDEAIRVLKTSPKWEPAFQNGKPVRVMYTIPIILNIEPDSNKELRIKGPELDHAYILLDGKNITVAEFRKIDPQNIESIKVIKDDKEKFKEYGAPEDATGVIIIKLK